jgi:hypothetical protein
MNPKINQRILSKLIIRFVTSTQRKVRFEVPLGELWSVDSRLSTIIQLNLRKKRINLPE